VGSPEGQSPFGPSAAEKDFLAFGEAFSRPLRGQMGLGIA